MDIAGLQASLEAERQLVHRKGKRSNIVITPTVDPVIVQQQSESFSGAPSPTHSYERNNSGAPLQFPYPGGDLDDYSGAMMSDPTARRESRSGSPSGDVGEVKRALSPKAKRRLDGFSKARDSSSALAQLHAKYEVYDNEEVGHGAYGVVIKGKNKQTGELVAIKRISKGRVTARLLSELQGEVETLSLVGNQWTINLEDVFQDTEHLLIIMDYVPGGNLSDALKKVGAFSEVSVRRFASCLLNAIDFLHGRGVVHRDLKPANCLLAEDIFAHTQDKDLTDNSSLTAPEPTVSTTLIPPPEGLLGSPLSPASGLSTSFGSSRRRGSVSSTSTVGHGSRSASHFDEVEEYSPTKCQVDVKIADFGFAVMVGNNQCLTNFCGTTSYMAPEIISRNKNYGKAVDIWSIGVMLYALLSGDLPFRGNSGDELAANVCRGQYSMTGPEWSHVSASAKDLISKMLVVDPGKRITARGALSHLWIRSAHGEGAAALEYPMGLPRSLSTYFARRRPPKRRLKGFISLCIAAHRLIYFQKCTELRKEGLGDIALFKSFSYLVASKYEPVSHSIVAGKQCSANPKAIHILADMVEASRTVETFDISSTMIDNADVVQHIVKVSAAHPSLQHLNMQDNPIPPLAGRALVRLARQALRLTTINVNNTSLGQDVIDQIATDLKENERKRHLDAVSPTLGAVNGSFGGSFGSPLSGLTSPTGTPLAMHGSLSGSFGRAASQGRNTGTGTERTSASRTFHSPTSTPGSPSHQPQGRSMALPRPLTMSFSDQGGASSPINRENRRNTGTGTGSNGSGNGSSSPLHRTGHRTRSEGRMSAHHHVHAVQRNLIESLGSPLLQSSTAAAVAARSSLGIATSDGGSTPTPYGSHAAAGGGSRRPNPHPSGASTPTAARGLSDPSRGLPPLQQRNQAHLLGLRRPA